MSSNMTPLDTYKKGIEETEEHFENIYYGKDEFGGRNFVSEHAVKDFLDMNKQSTLALLQALREEVGGMQKEKLYQMRDPDTGKLIGITESVKEFYETPCDGGSCEDVYNQCITDTLTTIDTLISNIEKHE